MKNLILILLLLVVGVVRADETDDQIKNLDSGIYLDRQIAQLKLETDLKPSVIAKLKAAAKVKECSTQVRVVCNKIVEKYYDVESSCSECPMPDISWLPAELDPVGELKKKYYEEANDFYYNKYKWSSNTKYHIDDFERSRIIGMWATQFYIRDKLDEGMRREDVSKILDMFVIHMYSSEDSIYSITDEAYDLVHKFILEQWEKIQEHGKVE